MVPKQQEILRLSLKSILAPVIRFCIRRRIKLQDVVELSKELFVELAEQQLELSAQKVSASRLSVMTGVHRKDVNRFLGTFERTEKQADLITRVLGQWQGDRRFTTKAGDPRVITVEGSDSEFVELVRSVNKELNPYTVLFELERIGAVNRSKRGLRLVRKAYIPVENIEEGLYFLETDSDDLINAVEENLFEKPQIPNLHITTEYDCIPVKSIPKIRQQLLQIGEKFHLQVRTLLSKHDLDVVNSNNTIEGVRVSVGTFSRVENRSYRGKDDQ